MDKRIKIGPQHRITAEQIPERMLAGLPPGVRRLIADGQLEVYILPEEKENKPRLYSEPIKRQDLDEPIKRLRQAKKRSWALFMPLDRRNLSWVCYGQLLPDKAQCKK